MTICDVALSGIRRFWICYLSSLTAVMAVMGGLVFAKTYAMLSSELVEATSSCSAVCLVIEKMLLWFVTVGADRMDRTYNPSDGRHEITRQTSVTIKS